MFSSNAPSLKGCLNAAALLLLTLLGGCLYAETPQGRMVAVELPAYSRTTVNKTVTVNAPPGTTVVYQEGVPVGYPHAVYPAYPPYPYPQTHPDKHPRAIERMRNRTRR